jgi:hypothetical protein
VRIFGQQSRGLEPNPYQAFVIGQDQLAIAVHSIVADRDDLAIEKAKHLPRELRIELWCGSRKVADIPAAIY